MAQVLPPVSYTASSADLRPEEYPKIIDDPTFTLDGCTPGTLLTRRDGEPAVYVRKSSLRVWPHVVCGMVAGRDTEYSVMSDGRFLSAYTVHVCDRDIVGYVKGVGEV